MKVTGSLQIKKEVYFAVLRLPDSKGGVKQKWETTGVKVGGKTSLAKATKILQQKIVHYEEQTYLPSDDMFILRVEEWLERKKTSIKLNTYEAYNSYFEKHIKPYFAPLKLKIAEVTPKHIQNYIDKKVKEGMNSNSVRRHFVVINGAMQEALRLDLIPYNPCDRIVLPKKKRFESKAYTSAEANQLLNCIKGEAIEPAVMLGLYLGLRRSEALGLRWKDIDFDTDTVKIRNTVVKTYSLIEMEQTKSYASRRDMHMTETLKTYLKRLRRKQTENKLRLGSEYIDDGHVCVWPNGKPLSPEYVSHRFAKILENNELPALRYHELRHTAGSLLIKGGQSIKEVQEYLGHERASTTLDTYIHLVGDTKKETAMQLEGILKVEVG